MIYLHQLAGGLKNSRFYRLSNFGEAPVFSPQPLDLIRNFVGEKIFYLLIRMVGKGNAGKKKYERGT
jgi:hypothetical protein